VEKVGSSASSIGVKILLAVSAVAVLGVVIWQALVLRGVPDPTQAKSTGVAALNIAVLVFREGLECILVLAAITASMTGDKRPHRKPVAAGAGVGFLASIATWFIAVGILNDLMESIPALHLQAATGLLAIVVLLIVMNWFFHNVYWGGWISLHNNRKRELLNRAKDAAISKRSLVFGLAMLGFFSMYREGFEVVLFLQSYRMRLGGQVVLGGTMIGLLLSGIVAVLTFIAHHKLPYRKMLVLTGVMLAGVLLIMVGEQAQEMQLAHWLPTTEIPALADVIPDWMGMWFALFPTRETIAAQAIAFVLVAGSYFLSRKVSGNGRPDGGQPALQTQPAL
jgi:high-affinity iron transporter